MAGGVISSAICNLLGDCQNLVRQFKLTFEPPTLASPLIGLLTTEVRTDTLALGALKGTDS